MTETLTKGERLQGLERHLSDTLKHDFRFMPTGPWRMGDSEQNAAMGNLYPAADCVEGFCANCALYLVADLRYSPADLPWSVIKPCDQVRAENNKHPRDAMRNDGRALLWAAHHGLSKMVVQPRGEDGDGGIRMRWHAEDDPPAAKRRQP